MPRNAAAADSCAVIARASCELVSRVNPGQRPDNEVPVACRQETQQQAGILLTPRRAS